MFPGSLALMFFFRLGASNPEREIHYGNIANTAFEIESRGVFRNQEESKEDGKTLLEGENNAKDDYPFTRMYRGIDGFRGGGSVTGPNPEI
ncbi:MAG: hypothetical protein JXA11_13075 [Phycisphaerae bacterium]|nr:hypothetical protein [Phycisphaerae bacterium]